MYLNVDYKAIVLKIRHVVLKIFEQLYKIFEQLFQILATFEQLFGIFLSNFLPFSEQNLDAPNPRRAELFILCKLGKETPALLAARAHPSHIATLATLGKERDCSQSNAAQFVVDE